MQAQGFQRIIVATDGSEEAGAALAVTASFARPSGAHVRVVHVWNLAVHHRQGVWDVEMRSEAEKIVAAAVERLRADGVDADAEIDRAEPNQIADAVAQAARGFGADLVVVGSRALSDWRSITEHSVSHGLLTRVDCPLLIVRASATTPPSSARRVLVAVAGGDDIEPAVRAAIAAASAPGSKVLVLHVAQAMFSSLGPSYVETEGEISETIQHAVSLLAGAGLPVESRVADAGPVATIVAGVAARWNADVIVTGSSRMGDLSSMVFGSVSHGLLRASDRPLLISERIPR